MKRRVRMGLSILVVIGIFCCSLATGQQQLKEVLKGHIDEGVRFTKGQLGLSVWVKGQAGYKVPQSADGVNTTFVLSGRDLGTNDAFVKIRSDTGGYTSIGNTESGTDTTSPDWTQAFWFIWKKGTHQKLNFEVVDHNDEDRVIGETILDVDLFGGNELETKEIRLQPQPTAAAGNSTSSKSGDDDDGVLIIQRTKVLKFKLSASNIERSDEFNGKSDPYVKVYFRNGEHGKDTKFYTTSTLNNVENANWPNLVEFPNYRPKTNQYLHFKLRDSDSVTQDDHLGEVLVEADSIGLDSKPEQTLYLENSGKHTTLTIIQAK